MKNFERYKSIDEQIIAHERYCKKHAKYGDCKNCIECALRWIFLEAEEELKPCPFCGGTPTVNSTIAFTDGGESRDIVMCNTCGIQFHGQNAIEKWNRRAES